MNSVVDLVVVSTTSTGTGPFQLGGAVTGFFGTDQLVDGATYSYSVQNFTNGQVEKGTGTWDAGAGTLSRTVTGSTSGNEAVNFQVGVSVALSPSAADWDALVVLAQMGGQTAKTAFNAYGLLWGLWFAATPGASELLALYSAAVEFQFLPNFNGAAVASPITAPTTAAWVGTIDRQVAGAGAWTTIGSITIAEDGTVTLATVNTATPTVIAVGDRLRFRGPSTPDASLAGFSCTLKGYIP